MKRNIFKLMLLCGVHGVIVTHAVTQDTNINIGVSHTLDTTQFGGATYNSIAGGMGNTNNAVNTSSILSGMSNWLAGFRQYATTTNASNPNTNVNDWCYNSAIVGGQHNTILSGLSVISGGWLNRITSTNKVPGNSTNLWQSQIGAHLSTIGGGYANEIHSPWSVIGGGFENRLGEWANYSTISGGLENTIDYGSGYSVISGGSDNVIARGAWWGAINGGQENQIYGQQRGDSDLWEQSAQFEGSHWGWIGGGYENVITNDAVHVRRGVLASIGGGGRNLISGEYGTVGGGDRNRVKGDNATVPGGAFNYADGNYSFAAGYRAKATNTGSFVWADSTAADFNSTADNQFSARVNGGVRFISSGAGTNTVSWSPGGTSWSFSSDRALKENFAAINKRELLTKVVALPIEQWNFIGHHQRHIGPVAQDFHASFPLNENDKAIDSGDIAGVALAAIQGLNQIVEEKDTQISAQAAQIRSLEERLKLIESRLAQ